MNYKKSACIISFILILINAVIWCYKINQPNEKINETESFDNNDNIVIAIYPSGSTNETYYFDISKTGKIMETFGTRKTNDISSKNFMCFSSAYSCTQKTAYLKQNDIVRLLKILLHIIDSKNPLDYKVMYDSWDMAVYYNKQSYYMNCFTDNVYIEELKNLMVDIAPIHVDLHGWS